MTRGKESLLIVTLLLIFLSCESTLTAISTTQQQETNCTAGFGLISGKCIECEEGTFANGSLPYQCTKCGEGMSTYGVGATAETDCDRDLGSVPTWYFQVLTFCLILERILTGFQRHVLIGRMLGKGQKVHFFLGLAILTISVLFYFQTPMPSDSFRTGNRETVGFVLGFLVNLILMGISLLDREFKTNAKINLMYTLFAGVVLGVVLFRSFLHRKGFAQNDIVVLLLLFLAIEAQSNVYLDGFEMVGKKGSVWEMWNSIISFLVFAAFAFLGLPLLFKFGTTAKDQALEKPLESNVWVAQTLFAVITASLSLVAQFIGKLQTAHADATTSVEAAFQDVLDVKVQSQLVDCAVATERTQGTKRLAVAVGEFFDQPDRHTILCKWLELIQEKSPTNMNAAAFLLGRPKALEECQDATENAAMKIWMDADAEFNCNALGELVKLLIEATKLRFHRQGKVNSLHSYLTEDYTQSWVLQLFVLSSLFGSVFNTVRHGANMQGQVKKQTRDHVFLCITVVSGIFFMFLIFGAAVEMNARETLVKTVTRFDQTKQEKHKFRNAGIFQT